MKLLVLLTLLSLYVSIRAQECRIFGCGNINQDPQKPIKGVEGFQDGHFNVEKCFDPKYHGDAIIWAAAEEADTNFCVETQNFRFPTLPGDVGDKDVDGFGNTDEVFCAAGVCTTVKEIGSSCPDSEDTQKHKFCPIGSYGSDQVCTSQKGLDVVCEGDNSCRFGLKCIAKNTALDDYRGTPTSTIGDQVKFAIDRFVNGDNIWNGFNSMGISYNSDKTDDSNVRICRKADISQKQEVGDYVRDKPGDIGKYTRFSDQFPIEGEPSSDEARCGFNRRTNAYCRMRKGDSWFKERLNAFRETDLRTLNGHTMSNVEKCKEFLEAIDKDVIHQFNQSTFAVDEKLGYYLFADNDRGVATTITTQFWNGRLPGSAFFAFTIIPAILINLLNSVF